MKTFIIGSLTVAIAVTLGAHAQQLSTIAVTALDAEQSEYASETYSHRRYTGGTGRREILS
ncbi:hypothetical protein PN498_01825 [Oscillatoria sp. CS-180]|uniref:hypothetical protein n=1 Tax=Oscillatoria sp. CS-180 TaxID=3021720 RepID=UPI00232AAFC7|nr:hypothetical protein [Oscillatoria sp. CS-180]MDB9524714.1 hypothetical protein [Oscillatoria sp. CS-180]